MRPLLSLLFVALLVLGCDASGPKSQSSESSTPQFSQVTVESITVNNFPATTDSGAPWDDSSAPDLALQVLDNTKSSVGTTDGSVKNVSRNALPVKYDGAPFRVSDLSAEYSVRLYDLDAKTPDYVGEVNYSLDSFADKRPETTTISANGIRYTLELNWSE